MSLGKKIKMYYDPRGQVIETVNPDDSLQTVFFGEVSDLENPQNYTPTPWVSFSYDANDNAQRRSSGGTGLYLHQTLIRPKVLRLMLWVERLKLRSTMLISIVVLLLMWM